MRENCTSGLMRGTGPKPGPYSTVESLCARSHVPRRRQPGAPRQVSIDRVLRAGRTSARRRRSCSGSTGFVRWWSKPAAFERSRSATCPHPVSAINDIVRPRSSRPGIRANRPSPHARCVAWSQHGAVTRVSPGMARMATGTGQWQVAGPAGRPVSTEHGTETRAQRDRHSAACSERGQ